MNWDAIGAVGEIVGAAAVVATLAYLALQLKENTRHIRRAERNAGFAQVSEFRLTMMRDADFVDIWTRGHDDFSSLTQIESTRFDSGMNQMLWTGYNIWDRALMKIIDVEEWEGTKTSILELLDSSGGKQWWENNSHQVPAAYRSELSSFGKLG